MYKDAASSSPANDDELLPLGAVCGFCQFPTGKDQICGNPVYATAEQGRLPVYCGAPGQHEWQTQHGTPGNPKHIGPSAGYPRKKFGMTAERAAELAKQRAAELNIHHRAPRKPVAADVSQPHSAVVVPLNRAAAESERAKFDKLNEFLLAAGELATQLRDEVESERNASDERVTIAVQREQAAVEAERLATQQLADVKASMQDAVDTAESSAATARDEQLRAEGKLASAREQIAALESRIQALESQIAEMRVGHQHEIEAVRRAEAERADQIIARITAVAQQPKAPAPDDEEAAVPQLNKSQRRILEDVHQGLVKVVSHVGPGGQSFGLSFQHAGGGQVPDKLLRQMADAGLIGWSFSGPGAAESPQGRYTTVQLTEQGADALMR